MRNNTARVGALCSGKLAPKYTIPCDINPLANKKEGYQDRFGTVGWVTDEQMEVKYTPDHEEVIPCLKVWGKTKGTSAAKEFDRLIFKKYKSLNKFYRSCFEDEFPTEMGIDYSNTIVLVTKIRPGRTTRRPCDIVREDREADGNDSD